MASQATFEYVVRLREVHLDVEFQETEAAVDAQHTQGQVGCEMAIDVGPVIALSSGFVVAADNCAKKAWKDATKLRDCAERERVRAEIRNRRRSGLSRIQKAAELARSGSSIYEAVNVNRAVPDKYTIKAHISSHLI